MRLLGLAMLASLAVSGTPATAAQGPSPRFVARLDLAATPATPGDLPPEKRARIEARIAANLAALERAGLLERANAGSVLLDFPLRGVSAALGPGVHTTPLFVDQEPARPDALLDWNCGARTYDLPGYNHAGTDFVLWPYPWLRLERREVLVVAAADGVIVDKDDGYPDHSCDWNGPTDWNAVYVRHADGTVAWYGHLRTGSTTSKPIGASVDAGEVLGFVGSSGMSSAPHLHFELHDPQNLLLDPYSGPCNRLNARSMWRRQTAYYDSAINAISTHSGVPERLPCPQVEIPKQKNSFQPGETVYFAAFYREQLAGQVTELRVLRPDGSLFSEWSSALEQPFLRATMWVWEATLPDDAPFGTWRFLASYEGREVEHRFGVGPCVAGDRLCLLGGRFEVEVDWQNPYNGTAGRGVALPVSDLAGFFAFADPANVELMVKILDFGDRVLVFYGQLTTLPFTLRVIDRTSGEVKSYGNGPGDCGAIDPAAFRAAALGAEMTWLERPAVLDGEAASAARPREAGAVGCAPDDETLCLLDGRFRVRLSWSSQYSGASGRGRALSLSRLTGSFSFDNPQNLEVLVKTLDFGDRVLVFWGSLSDLGYSLEVTETTSGRSKSYTNPPGHYCGGLDPAF